VDQQGLGVGFQDGIDIEVEIPVTQVLIFERVGSEYVQATFELLPDFVADFMARALTGRLAGDESGRIPVRNVDGNNPTDRAIAEAAQVDVRPELALRDGGQGPWRIQINLMAPANAHVFCKVELDPIHPCRAF